MTACVALALAVVGCGEPFAPGSADAGTDAPPPNHDGGGDGSLLDARADGRRDDVSSEADVRMDAPAGDGPRVDAVSSDVARDAPRSDAATPDSATSDATPDGATTDVGAADVRLIDALADGLTVDVPCVPETDPQFCARLGKNCEMVSAPDNCGATRSANCGTCTAGTACVDRVCKAPVCNGYTYASAVFQPFSLAGTPDFVIAASAAGETVLYAQSRAADCSAAITYLADEMTPGSRNYTSRAIVTWLDEHNLTGQALTGDGLGLITLSRDYKSYQSARRSALQLVDFGLPSPAEFAEINALAAGNSAMLQGGALSADGLEFYFTISGLGPAMDGIYGAKRADTKVPFAAASRLDSIDPSYTTVTGISSDRLTLFVFKPWAGFVFTRSSTTAAFSNPNAPNPPPELAGWQHKPLADCATLLATSAVGGGCANDDIVFLTRR